MTFSSQSGLPLCFKRLYKKVSLFKHFNSPFLEHRGTALCALYRIFCKKGCKGDKTACHKGFAPFLEGDKGDRRVTDCDTPLPCRGGVGGGVSNYNTRGRNIRAGGCQCLGTSRHALEFSRGFDRQKPAERCEVAFFYGITACHPSVTLVTHEKGCKRPVHRRFVTLSPFFTKNPIQPCFLKREQIYAIQSAVGILSRNIISPN